MAVPKTVPVGRRARPFRRPEAGAPAVAPPRIVPVRPCVGTTGRGVAGSRLCCPARVPQAVSSRLQVAAPEWLPVRLRQPVPSEATQARAGLGACSRAPLARPVRRATDGPCFL